MQSVAIKMSILKLSSGESIDFSFDMGEKQVRTVFKSVFILGTFERPATSPVTMAVCIPYFSRAYFETWS